MNASALLPLFFCTLLQCGQSPLPAEEPEWLSYFHSVENSNSARFELSQEEQYAWGDTIPNRIFFRDVPADLMAPIDYLADTTEATTLSAMKRFRLNDSLDACLVGIRYAWFQHQSLFVYNRKNQRVTDRITVAEFYGGDGGQVQTGAWMLDFDQDGDTDLVIRHTQHSLRMEEEDVKEEFLPSAELLLFQDGKFEWVENADQAMLIRRFPMSTFWD